MEIRAPVAGVVIPPPPRDGGQGADGKLPLWSDSALAKKNLGAHLQETDLVCQLGDPGHMEAVMFVDQADIELVREQQDVEIKLDAYPYQLYQTRIEEIARRNVNYSPPSLSNQAGGDLPTQTDPKTGAQKLVHASYQARAGGRRRRARLRHARHGQDLPRLETVRLRAVWRWLTRTFNFEL